MNSGQVKARFYATGEAVDVAWKDGLITSIHPAADSALSLPWLAPGLIDHQINGFAGVDLQKDALNVEELLTMVRALRRQGCLHFFPTLLTDDWDCMLSRLERLKSLCQGDPELALAIVGWHLEGPFLSRKPGYYGAHDPAKLLDPTLAHLQRLREIAGTDRVLLTLAPEVPGGIEAIAGAVSLGFQVFLGHTDASAEVLMAALRAGASGFTHLGNGCPVELHRFDNILWRVLDLPFPRISLIPDGAHMSAPLFRLIHRLKPEAAFYITDAMAAAAAPEGRYTMGRLNLEVGADRVVRLPGTPNLAGSALTPIQGVMRAAQMLGCPWQEVWPRFSEKVAAAWGMPGTLDVGGAADFVLLDSEDERARMRVQPVIAGRLIDSEER